MFWGKTRSTRGCVEFHPLADHCMDVAAVFGALVRLPRVRAALESTTIAPLGDLCLDRLAALAFLHDIGKCNWGFQAKSSPDAPHTTGHVLEAAALLCDSQLAQRWPKEFRALLEAASQWFEGGETDLLCMLLAAISHHGRPVSFNDWRSASGLARWWEVRGISDPMAGVAELAVVVHDKFPAAFASGGPLLKPNAGFQQRFAGLVMLADWIGSDTRFFPYRSGAEEDRLQLATEAAHRALDTIGVAPPPNRRACAFAETFGFAPNAVQHLLSTDLAVDESSRLLVLESETGSGKTEAALAWFLRLYSAGRVDGLYFALPTRVAAREIYDRIWRAMRSAFPDPSSRPGPVLLAAPGYVKLDGEAPLLADPEGLLWEDDADARRRERAWSAERPKRFLAAPVAVGTIDQALLSTLRVKHSLLRSVCLDRHLLVVDEVHASDAYMREVLSALLRGHLARGGHALLLSATLGEAAAAQYLQRPMLPLAQATDQAYPRVSSAAGQSVISAPGVQKTVDVEMIDDFADTSVLPGIRAALDEGARVLVICNTVARANALLRSVEVDDAIDPSTLFGVAGIRCPHHGRFARQDRELLDAAVTAAFGKGAAAAPLLLVGTQTLEQSLDIDADWLVTDLCPIDVLVQRIGRLHRHQRKDRPANYSRPRLLLRAPPGFNVEQFVASDGALRGPAGIGRVYADGRMLQLTLDILKSGEPIVIPADNRRLVEQTTHPEALAACRSAPWARHAGHLYGVELAALQAAIAGTVAEQPFGELHWPAPDESVLTRLGAANIQVRLAGAVSVFPGNEVTEVGIPAHMLPREKTWPEVVNPSARSDGGFGFALGGKRYMYTRFGLEMDDA